MPILTAMPIQVVDREEFHRIDRQVTGFAFDIHNEFGRYLHESLYQQELGRRLQEAGYHVVLEYEMTVRLGDFSKLYFADLLVNSGVIVETKAVNTLTNLHQGQTLNYLYMCDLHHATLLIFAHSVWSTNLFQRQSLAMTGCDIKWMLRNGHRIRRNVNHSSSTCYAVSRNGVHFSILISIGMLCSTFSGANRWPNELSLSYSREQLSVHKGYE